jgi:hypothetical protein
MAHDLDEVIAKIMQDYRHLMTEAERRADRAYVFQQQMHNAGDARAAAEMEAAMRQALEDPAAAELFERGRERFLQDVARRVVAEHGATLPRCGSCGGVLKTPNPKRCFDCDY